MNIWKLFTSQAMRPSLHSRFRSIRKAVSTAMASVWKAASPRLAFFAGKACLAAIGAARGFCWAFVIFTLFSVRAYIEGQAAGIFYPDLFFIETVLLPGTPLWTLLFRGL